MCKAFVRNQQTCNRRLLMEIEVFSFAGACGSSKWIGEDVEWYLLSGHVSL